MSTRKIIPLEELTNLSEICRQLANPKKLAVIHYLQIAGLATATVIQRKLQYKQATVSKYLHALTDCQLLTREKIGYCIVYSVNQETWSQFNGHLSDLGN